MSIANISQGLWVSLVSSLVCLFVQVNPELKSHFEETGFCFVGQDVEGERMEVIELDGTEDKQTCMSRTVYFRLPKIQNCCFRPSIFCWSAVPPWVHLSPHQAIAALPWSVTGICREAAELSTEGLPPVTTVITLACISCPCLDQTANHWSLSQGHIQRPQWQQHTRLGDIRIEVTFHLKRMRDIQSELLICATKYFTHFPVVLYMICCMSSVMTC